MSENVGFGANKLIISVPSCETPASVDWAINLASQYWPLTVSIEYSSQEGVGQDLDLLRNYTVAYALGTKTKYIWFVRENSLPPNWAVHRLLEAMRVDPKIMICAGMSRTNVPESVEFLDEVTVFVDENKNEFEVLSLTQNNHVGLECTLIKTEVFDLIPEPWFKSTDLVKSDSRLCYEVMAAGYKVCAHSGVMCGRVDESGRSHWPEEALVAV
jgi:hypothetical protein